MRAFILLALSLAACAAVPDDDLETLVPGGKDDADRSLVVSATGGSKDYALTCTANRTCHVSINWYIDGDEGHRLAEMVMGHGVRPWSFLEEDAFVMEVLARDDDGQLGASLVRGSMSLNVVSFGWSDEDMMVTWLVGDLLLTKEIDIRPGQEVVLRLTFSSPQLAAEPSARGQWFESEVWLE